MRCPNCDSENAIGASYCTGCGAKLQISSERAQIEAVASVRHDNWRKACLTLNRTLFLFLLAFVASLLFNAYARREVIAQFSASAPLPRPEPLTLKPSFIRPPALPVPKASGTSALKPEKTDRAEIVAAMAQTARKQLDCVVFLKIGTTVRIVRGVLLFRDEKEIQVITRWPPRTRIRVIDAAAVDFKNSKLPQ